MLLVLIKLRPWKALGSIPLPSLSEFESSGLSGIAGKSSSVLGDLG